MDEDREDIAEQPAGGVPVDDQTRAAVMRWLAKVHAAEKFHEPAFKKMRRNMDLARMGADGDWIGGGNYVANIIQRHISQSVASLYAKNPRSVAKRRERLEYRIWDGKAATAMQAYQTVSMAAQPVVDPMGMPAAPAVDPVAFEQAQAVLADIAEAQQRIQMLDRIGKTVEVCFHYSLNEQQPRFKPLAKQLVRRAKVCGVGYLKLGFQRVLERQPDISARLDDVTLQVATLERMMADAAGGEYEEDDGRLVELRALQEELQSKLDIVVREGPVFLFPAATAIVPDPKVKQLNGFVGADWVAEKYVMTPDEVKEVYKVDLGKNYKEHRSDRLTKFEQHYLDDSSEKEKDRHLCIVWEIWNKKTGLVQTVADGYPGFLKPPAAPAAPLERFWPWFTLSFNEGEHESESFPLSDVELLSPMQEEYNRSRQGLREQRRANRPKYAVSKGKLEDSDIEQLKSHPANAVLQIASMTAGENINNLIQRFQPVPIDPALYDTGPVFEDALRVVGTQEAQFGQVSGGTATESAIAEGARVSTQTSDVDDLDEMLTDLARATGQLMLMEMSAETVTEIAGPGAVWPQMRREAIAKEVFLEVKAGSSGRPNRAAELANLERVAPTILQIPGISPEWFAKQVLERMDDGIDLSDAIVEGLPSIVAMNAMARGGAGGAQPATGDPATDPQQQGGAGGGVADDQANRNEPGGQPAFPT